MTDDDLKELAYSAHEEAMSFGLSHDTFLRYFKTIRDRSVPADYKLVPGKITPAIEAAIKEVAPKWFAPSVWVCLLDAASEGGNQPE